MHPLRAHYIALGFITPLPDKLTVPEMVDRGFWAAVAARIK